MGVIDIERFLRDEGFAETAPRMRARLALEAAGLTNPRKKGMDEGKLPRAREVLEAAIVRVCSKDCLSLAPHGREALLVSPAERCQVCNGSNNRRAALLMAGAMHRHRAHKLLIVGGTENQHRELRALLTNSGVEVRGIDGAQRKVSQKDAWADLNWADVTVVWASTPLPHKVSEHYTNERIGRAPITVARRGIEALCNEVRLSLERHGV